MLTQIKISRSYLKQLVRVFIEQHLEQVLATQKHQKENNATTLFNVKKKVFSDPDLLEDFVFNKSRFISRLVNYDFEHEILFMPKRYWLCEGKIRISKLTKTGRRMYWYKAQSLYTGTQGPSSLSWKAKGYKELSFPKLSYSFSNQSEDLQFLEGEPKYLGMGKLVCESVTPDPNDLAGLFWDWLVSLEGMNANFTATEINRVHSFHNHRLQIGSVQITSNYAELGTLESVKSSRVEKQVDSQERFHVVQPIYHTKEKKEIPQVKDRVMFSLPI